MERQILDTFDRLAASFELPVFTEEHEIVLDARLHAHRDGDRWVVLIEQLVYCPEEGGFQGGVAAFGPDMASRRVHIWYPLDPRAVEVDEDVEPIGPAVFRVGDIDAPVDWSASRTAAAEHGTAPELEAFAAICAAHRDALFLDRQELDRHAGGAPRILVAEAWTHPDLRSGELPSSIEDWRRIARALAEGGAASFEPAGTPNSNDWRHWIRLMNG